MPYVRSDPANANPVYAACRQARHCVRRVGILVFEGFSLIDAGLVAEMFHAANRLFRSRPGAERFYDVLFISPHGGNIACSSSVLVWTTGIDDCREIGFNVLFIAGAAGAHITASEVHPPFRLHAVYPNATTVTDSDAARALLVAAGILRNPEGPQYHHSLDAASVDDPGRLHEALNNTLAMIRSDLGQGIARGVAEGLTANWNAGLLPPPDDDGRHSVGDKMRQAARWLHENFERPISVADVARIAAMSERHFLRCFKSKMGTLPSDYLLQVRLGMATRLLAETELPVDKIARRTGLSNGDRLAKIFRKRLSVSPIEFRKHSRSEA